MKEKLTLSPAILVEGKYDKIKLEALVDGLILPVHGFSVFTDQPLQQLIVQLADQRGLIVLMDSDAAGFRIRGFLSGLVPSHQITHVYIPDVEGKERRKRQPSREGTLGVEGMTVEVLRQAFDKAGVLDGGSAVKGEEITKTHFYQLGYTGRPHSQRRRRQLYEQLGLPAKMSTNRALDVINSMLSLEQLVTLTQQLEQEE